MAYHTLRSGTLPSYEHAPSRERRRWRWLTYGSITLVASLGYVASLWSVRSDLDHYIQQNRAFYRYVEAQDFSPARQAKLEATRANLAWAEEYARTGINPCFAEELRTHAELARASHQSWDSGASGP